MKNNVTDKTLSEEFLTDCLSSRNIVGKSKNYEISRMRVFARYLAAFEISAFELDFCQEKNYKTYTFGNDEIFRILEVTDSGVVNYKNAESGKVFPVVLRILYGTGMRINEVLSLKWTDVDLVNGIFIITQAKNNTRRLIVLA